MEQIYFQAIGYMCIPCFTNVDTTSSYKVNIAYLLINSPYLYKYSCNDSNTTTSQCQYCYKHFNITSSFRTCYKGNDYCSPSCMYGLARKILDTPKELNFRFHHGNWMTIPMLVMDSKKKMETFDTSKPLVRPRNKDSAPMLYSHRKVFTKNDFKLTPEGIALKSDSKSLAIFGNTLTNAIQSANV